MNQEDSLSQARRRAIWMLSALVLGATLGGILHGNESLSWLAAVEANVLAPIGQIFLRLIFMVVVPLVVSALVLGVVELGQGAGLRRAAGRTLLYTLIASTCSVFLGIGLVDLFKPGEGFTGKAPQAAAKALETVQQNAAASKSFADSIVELVPKNPIETASKALSGEMISLMVFALILGWALSRTVGKEEDSVLLRLFRELLNASMKIVSLAMQFAPLAIFAIVFGTLYRNGAGVLVSLGKYVLIVVLGLLLQQFVVYTILIKTLAKRSPLAFFRACREVYLSAFSTASSNATLPLSLETAETRLGLRPRISRFVLTIGATANQNGTALFEGITVLFLAQVYAVDLSLGQQIQVVLMSILAGIGTAGVPGGSLPLILILLQSVGIPPEGLGLILGADRFLDMCRTTLNVSGDLVIAALVDAGEPPEAQPTLDPAAS